MARAELKPRKKQTSALTRIPTRCGAGCSPHISSVPEDEARRCRQSQRCRNRQAKQLRGWSRLPRLNYLGNQISAGALRGDHAALGDSDKPAGKIPSEMQKRCTGEKERLLITAEENGLLIGWRQGGSAERLRGPEAGGEGGVSPWIPVLWSQDRGPRGPLPLGNAAASPRAHRQPVRAWSDTVNSGTY